MANVLFCFVVLGVYYMLYLPAVIDNFLRYKKQFYVQSINSLLLSCNGIATPLIYAWQSQTFRQRVLEMYGIRQPPPVTRSGDEDQSQRSAEGNRSKGQLCTRF